MSKVYVTFNIRLTPYLGSAIKRYAIKCDNDNEAYDIASDVNSIDRVSYIRFRHSKPYKDAKVMTAEEYLKNGGV